MGGGGGGGGGMGAGRGGKMVSVKSEGLAIDVSRSFYCAMFCAFFLS